MAMHDICVFYSGEFDDLDFLQHASKRHVRIIK